MRDDKKHPEDNNGAETERSDESKRLMRRQMELMVGKAWRSKFGVQEMAKLDDLRADHFGERVCTKRKKDDSSHRKK